MKILIVNSFYYPNMFGGAEHSIKNLAEELYNQGNSVYVLCTGNTDQFEEINNVNVYRIKNNNIKSTIEYMNNENKKLEKVIYKSIDLHGYTNKNKISNIIDEIKPDIVHINNMPGIGLNIFNILEKKKIPIIFTGRDYYTICPKTTLIKSDNSICKTPNKFCKMYRKINQKYISKADYLIGPSKFSKDILSNELKIDENKCSYIYNSIDLDKDYTSKVNKVKNEMLLKKKTLDLVFLGTLDYHKGIKLLVEQFINLDDKNIRLHIAGDGPLKEYIKSIKLDNLIYYGKLSKEDVNKLLSECDILIAPSLWNEPFGRIVLDAYKNSMPVITTGNGGLREIVNDGETGYIINMHNIDEFSDVVKKYKSNKELLMKQINKCNEHIKDYDNKIITKKYLDLYNEIILAKDKI